MHPPPNISRLSLKAIWEWGEGEGRGGGERAGRDLKGQVILVLRSSPGNAGSCTALSLLL